jgi:hypothetical protein
MKINKLELTQDNVLLWYDCNGTQTELGNIKDANMNKDWLLINNECYPIDSRFESDRELQTAWDELYPNGKPVEVVETEPQPSTEDLDKSEMTLKIIETLTELGVI